MAEAGYVVLIIDPQGQGDSESCGHRARRHPDDAARRPTSRTTPARRSTSSSRRRPSPYPLGAGRQRRRHADLQPVLAERSTASTSASPATRSEPSRSRRSARRTLRVDAVISYDNLDLSLAAGAPRRTPSLYFGTDYAFPATGTPEASPPDPHAARRSLRPAGRRRRRLDVDHDAGQQPLRVRLPARSRPTSRRAATASGSRSTTRWPGSTAT